MRVLPPALHGLTQYSQFVISRNKIPVDPTTLNSIDAYKQNNWLDSITALKYLNALGAGYSVGFVLTKQDPFFFIDIDHCLNPDGATWSELCVLIYELYLGAAFEVSQSNKGIHLIGRCNEIEHKCKNTKLDIELYTENRIISLTGTNAVGDCNTFFDMTHFVNKYFKPLINSSDRLEWTSEPVPEWTGYVDDDELIKHALRSKGFNTKCTFKDLWQRNEDALSVAYPDHHGNRSFDDSSVDAALIMQLSFWTGKDCQRMHDLLWKSALVRDKWNVQGYLERSILNGVSLGGAVYTHVKKNACDLNISSGFGIRDGDIRLSIEGQAELFKNCVYVKDINCVLTNTFEILGQEAFNWEYGGYIFELHVNDMTKTTTNAWHALRNSLTLICPTAKSTCFRTDLKFGEIIKVRKRELANVYVEIDTERKKGDPALFLDLLSKMLPSARDRQILLSYMSACIQYKGQKLRYAPVLQGTEGNGKSMILDCLEFAIGEEYTHKPIVQDIKSKFNSWVSNKILICVEEIYAPGRQNEIIEALKVLITNEKIGVQPKGIDQYMIANCANFIFTTQHRDAIKKTKDQRRFCIFFTAQQCKKDMIDCGMDDAYFNRLKLWFEADGYAIVNEYLCTYEIVKEFDPTLLARAPDTSMINEVIRDSRSNEDNEIEEGIKEGRIGFRDRWVSTMALDKFLKEKGLSKIINIGKRKELLKELGYIPHPHLKDGRVNRITTIDLGKPRLYVKIGSIQCNIENPEQITLAYEKAQNSPVITPIIGKRYD